MMSQVTISVRPLRRGWSVDCGPGFAPQVFIAGGAAERTAVRLAAAFTHTGREVRVVIHDRLGRVAGELIVGPYIDPQLRRFSIH